MRLFLSIAFSLTVSLPSVAQHVEGWFNYGWEVFGASSDCNYFLSHVYPDSTVWVMYSNGPGRPWMHSVGQVMDPTSGYFNFGNVQSLNSYTPYSVDSISFAYRYYRYQDQAPDTVLVQVFHEADFEAFYEDPWAGDPNYEGRSYARLSYDSDWLAGDTPSEEYTVLLDNEDTSSVKTALVVPVSLEAEAGEVVAVTITYLPGNTVAVNDTLDATFLPEPQDKINDFILYYFADNDLLHTTGNYNHALIARDDARYDIPDFNWDHQYWPGMASGAGIYHMDVNFWVSADMVAPPLGLAEVNGVVVDPQLVPNPSRGPVKLQLNAPYSEPLAIEVLDLSGKVVWRPATQSVASGFNSIVLEMPNVAPGLYLCRIEGRGWTQSVKFNRQ